jgi:uncharacterized phage protein gp47/JayE
VDLVFLLLIPATAQGEYLAALAAVSRHLRDKEFAVKRCRVVQPTLRSPPFVIFAICG